MPRETRKESGTGIYHVMMRGINRQDIFEEQEDYVRMLMNMQQMLEPLDEIGYRQLSRLTGVPYGVIHRLNSKMNKK